MKAVCFFLCMLLVLLTGCAPADNPSEPTTEMPTVPIVTEPVETVPPTTLPPETTLPPDPLDLLMEQMSLREKVGQLFIVRPDAIDPALSDAYVHDTVNSGVTALSDTMREMLAEYPVGGFILFHGNLESPEQVTAFNAALTDACPIAPFLSIDEEGGIVARLARHAAFDLPRFKSAAAVGAAGTALEMGQTIGAYLNSYGFNLDFAPVADVNTNPYNPVIGSRAFSADPEIAGEMAAAMAEGLRENGVIPTFKHFPGHGDTKEDSHLGLAVSQKTLEELQSCEFLPFLQAQNTDMVMVGHIAVPEITGDLTPATLSPEIVTGILKAQLNFGGLVVTDAMNMGAITESYSSAEAAVLALQAGCDLILMPYDLKEAFDGVVAAAEDGTLSLEWLEETVRRILEFKMVHGILHV